MMRYLILLTTFMTLLGAEPHAFTEKRYIYSIDSEYLLEGTIVFEPEATVIRYEKPDVRTLRYDEEYLRISDASGTQVEEISLDEQFGLKMYMKFFRLIYTQDFKALEAYFSVERNETGYLLTPNESTAALVASMEVATEAGEVTQVKTVMGSNDVFTISIKH